MLSKLFLAASGHLALIVYPFKFLYYLSELPSYAFHLFGHMTAYGGLEGLLFHQIDLYAQGIVEIVFQGYELQQPHFGIVDLDQQIKVTAFPGLAPEIGAEDAQGPDLPVLGESRLVLLQDILDKCWVQSAWVRCGPSKIPLYLFIDLIL